MLEKQLTNYLENWQIKEKTQAFILSFLNKHSNQRVDFYISFLAYEWEKLMTGLEHHHFTTRIELNVVMIELAITATLSNSLCILVPVSIESHSRPRSRWPKWAVKPFQVLYAEHRWEALKSGPWEGSRLTLQYPYMGASCPLAQYGWDRERTSGACSWALCYCCLPSCCCPCFSELVTLTHQVLGPQFWKIHEPYPSWYSI